MNARSTLLALLLVSACSSSSPSTAAPVPVGMPDPGPLPPDPPPAGDDDDDVIAPDRVHVRQEGVFARKVLPVRDGFVVLWDEPVVLREAWGRPSRTLGKVSLASVSTVLYAPGAGRELIDVTAHPSGELTLLEASTEGWFLVRLAATGARLGELHVVDGAILTDPPALRPSESRSPIEERAHDVGRITSAGASHEAVFGATRTGRHSVVAYRWEWENGQFVQKTRTLAVPPHWIANTAIQGGTYDTFGQLEAHYGVHVGVDDAGIGYVGISHARLHASEMIKAFEKVFHETLAGDADGLDAYVTRIDPNGVRLGTSVVGTEDDEQLFELRAVASGVVALGRSERWNVLGTGFDAMAAHVGPDGRVKMSIFDVDRGDIALDAIEDGDGALLVVGASGYLQNSRGASVGEESHAFARRLLADGTTIPVALGLAPGAPRHNEARVVVRLGDGDLVIAGMTNGPGTHSHDGDPRTLRADGWLEEVPAPKLPLP